MEKDRLYTRIRGKLYDVTDFLAKHPGGDKMVRQAVKRDATCLFESYHVRYSRAEAKLKTLPTITVPNDELTAAGWDITPATEKFPYPNDSEVYKVIRSRVANEVLNGECGRGGVYMFCETLLILGTLLTTWHFWAFYPDYYTSVFYGLVLAWVGLGIQHDANHGAIHTWQWWQDLCCFTDDIGGASSLVWRYHHNVMHHVYSNDIDLDPDARSPFFRLDIATPWHWIFRFQILYFPFFMNFLGFAVGAEDIKAGLSGAYGMVGKDRINFHGASTWEYCVLWAGKILHYSMHLAAPIYMHGIEFVPHYLVAYFVVGSTLSITFISSHNTLETKEPCHRARDDWGRWQVETSCNYGGRIEQFLTGGLNYQIEHHLFPGVAHSNYNRISPIIKAECVKRGFRYQEHYNLATNFWAHLKYSFMMAGGETSPQALKI